MLRSVEWKPRAHSPAIGYRGNGNPNSQLRHGAPVKKGDCAKFVCLPASKGRSLVRSSILVSANRHLGIYSSYSRHFDCVIARNMTKSASGAVGNKGYAQLWYGWANEYAR